MSIIDPNHVLQLCKDFELIEPRFREADARMELGWVDGEPGESLLNFIADTATTILDLCACAKEYEIKCPDLRCMFAALMRGDYRESTGDNKWFTDTFWSSDGAYSLTANHEVDALRVEAHIRGRLAWLKRESVEPDQSDAPALKPDKRRAVDILKVAFPPNIKFSAPEAKQKLRQADPPVEYEDDRTVRSLLDGLLPYGIASSGEKAQRRWFFLPPRKL